MEKIITTIVPQLLSKLAKGRTTYTQKDLSDHDFPQFLIKRITFHLMRELNGEFKLPGEEWVNRKSDDLLSEWAELQRIFKREIQLPAYLAEEVVEKSVRECVGMTIQPRKVIPELLFEESVELDSGQLTERSSAITVNRFLVWSMVRYLEKKNKESLNITDAARIIESIDHKIVENYHPLNWLSLVKPLYELSGSTVHSDIFRRFFEHKGKNHLAKEFDLINGEIKESRFIEVLSSPSSMHVEGYKDDQQSLFQQEMNEGVVEAAESNEDLIENQDEMIEDLSDNTPFFQTFREDQVEEPEKWVDDDEEEKLSEPEESDEEEKLSDLKEDHAVEQASESEEDVDEELVSESEEEDAKVEIQDEELRAPWEEEEEDSYIFITHDDNEDSPVAELKDLYNEEQEGGDDEESEISKKDEPASDAVLLEIEDEEDSSILNRFMFDDSDTEDTLGSMESDGNKKVTTIYDELNLVRNDVGPGTMDLFGSLKTPEFGKRTTKLKLDDKSSDSRTEKSETIQKFSDIEEPESEGDSEDTAVPMWRSFLERDENEAKSAFQFDDKSGDDEEVLDIENSDEKLDEDGFIEEPIYDFTKKEVDLDEKIGDLSNWMKDVREKFIEELFGDSEDAYEQALSDIMEFDDWKNASKYIEKEIFTRNRIDVYDEIAVDFTDRLHSYFIENKS